MRYPFLLTTILSALFVPNLVLPSDARPIAAPETIASSLPSDTVCFIQTPDRQLLDLSHLCGISEQQSTPVSLPPAARSIEKPMFLNRRRSQITFSDGSQPPTMRSGGRCPGFQAKFCPPASFIRRLAQQQANEQQSGQGNN